MTPTRPASAVYFALLLLIASPLEVRAQSGTEKTPQPAVTPQLDFSGVIFGNYARRTDSAHRFCIEGAVGRQEP
jgi:hypothetical protein